MRRDDQREGHGDELDDDLSAVGDQLRDALIARAGEEPRRTSDAWGVIEQARAGRGRWAQQGVRPIQLLAAAAVLVVVLASATVLMRRDETGLRYGDPPTSIASPATETMVQRTDASVPGPILGSGSTSTSSSSPVSSSTTVASRRESTTTIPDTTPPVAPSSTQPPPNATFELRGNGVGVAVFGADDEATIAAVVASLGTPTEDGGYTGPGFWQFRTRLVRWSNVSLLFAERDGRRELAAWTYDSQYGTEARPLPNNLRLGISAAELQTLAPQPVSAGGLEGSTGLCFPDGGAKICAALDPPWQRAGVPDSGTVVSYSAGLLTY